MQKVAIIGKDSYIGNAIDAHLTKLGMTVEQVEAQDGQWENYDFQGVDTVIMVAAIVHRKDITDAAIYNEVNTRLPLRVAEKAKNAAVGQFVFFSTMAVYGKGRSITDYYVDENSPFAPATLYAKSKYAAEQGLKAMEDENFTVAVVRPPSVYGKGCKGNLIDQYIRIARKLPVIPKCHPNVPQGMLSVDNLAAAVGEIVADRRGGDFHPQDAQVISSAQMLVILRKASGRKAPYSGFLGAAGSLLRFTGPYKKLFGGIAYRDAFVAKSGLKVPMRTTAECLKEMAE